MNRSAGLLAFVLAIGALALGATPSLSPRALAAPPPADIDRESEPVVRALTDAMGGLKTWESIPCFRFDFVVMRDGKEASRYRHWWDKRNGRCRVEGPDGKGRYVTAIFGLADRKGVAFVGGIGESDPVRVAAPPRTRPPVPPPMAGLLFSTGGEHGQRRRR